MFEYIVSVWACNMQGQFSQVFCSALSVILPVACSFVIG